MKGTRWASTKVICPVYKAQTAQTIICAGLEPNSSIHMTFGAVDQRKAFEIKHCICDGFKHCPIYLISQGFDYFGEHGF